MPGEQPYAVSPEGVRALKGLVQKLPEQIGMIKTAGLDVITCHQENVEGLGPHSASINSVLQEISREADQATSPVNELKDKIEMVAAAYQGIIDNNRYGR